MEIRRHTKTYLVLEDVPMFGPVAAIAAISAGLILIWVVINRFPQHMGLAWLGGIASLTGTALLFFQKEKSQVILDRERKQLVIFRSKLFRKSMEETYGLAEIEEFSIETSADQPGERLIVRLHNGKTAPFTRAFKSNTTTYPGILNTLRRFAGEGTER